MEALLAAPAEETSTTTPTSPVSSIQMGWERGARLMRKVSVPSI